MSNITDVIAYLIENKRKDLADIVIRELKNNTKVIEHVHTPIQPIHIDDGLLKQKPFAPPYYIGDDLSKGGINT